MSLELSLQENTATMKQLIAVLQSGTAMPAAAAPAEDKPRRGRPPKAAVEAKAAEADHGTAAAAEEEAGNAPAADTTQQTASTEPSAAPAPATASAPTPPAIAFGDVTKKIIELNKSQKPGHGRDGVLAVIGHFLGTTEGKKVPDLEAVGKNAEIVAYVDAMLNAEDAGDDLGI